MTSQFLTNIFSTARKLFCSRSCFAAALMVLVFSFSGAAQAEEGWEESSIPMVAAEGYAREKCMKLNEGDQVHYRFSSINPLNFDIHYHPDAEILFKIKKENVSEFSGEFTSDAEQHYCFTWKNPKAYAAAWDVMLEYRVLPK